MMADEPERTPSTPSRSQFDGHVTPADHSACTPITVTLCMDDFLIVSVILDGYVKRNPDSDMGYSARMISGYVHKALGC